ncbi:MAG: hypothetical protein HYZ42_00990 [Bacteroidetes bacterium]|nr:hypothetical protein [Bacteroidota bacterium]
MAVILLLGCSIKYQLTLKGYYRPVDNNVFTYRKENFHLNSSIIDTSKIYCNAYPIDKPEYFDCYRFFGNGRLMSYRFFSKIDSSAFVNINVGGIGYYHVLNNIIRMQQFTVNGQHFKEGRGGMLIHNYGIVKENNIIMDHESIGKEYYAPRSNLENGYKLIFKKTQIDAPLLHPTW